MRLIDQLHVLVEAQKERYDDVFLAESAGVNDFVNILGSQMNRSLVQVYREVDQPWQRYVKQGQVGDFRSNDRIAGSQAEDLLDLGPGGTGPYQDSGLSEQKWSVRAKTKGRAFSVTRQAIYNDDLQFLQDQPVRFGTAAARTLTKDVVQTTLEGNLTAYDGVALFHASHGNLNTGGGSTLTSANLNTARVAIRKARFEGEFMGLQPRYLVVPPELENAAKILLNSEYIPQPGTGIGALNPDQGTLELIVDQWLTSATAWYVLADPVQAPMIEVVYLDGQREPDLMWQMPEYRRVGNGGGEDRFLHGEFDEFKYAVRFDYGISVAMYQGAYKGNGA